MMHRIIAAVFVVVLAVSFTSVSFAQDAMKKDMEMKKEMKKDDGMALKSVSCSPECGFMVRSHDEKELVSVVKEHAKKAHNMEMSDKEVMGMMKDAHAGGMKKETMKKMEMNKGEKK